MKKRIRKTPWYPGSIEPLRPGMYQRRLITGVVQASRWSGSHWQYRGGSRWLESAHQYLEWRGQTKP